jgi:hypothetical protein
MYGWTEHEIGRLHRQEIRQEVAVARLAGELRANRGGEFRLARNLMWELSRIAGLLGKRLGNAG